MRFHLLMLIIVVLVSLSMHSMANAASLPGGSAAVPATAAPPVSPGP